MMRCSAFRFLAASLAAGAFGLVGVPLPASAQAVTCEELKLRKDSVYGFRPSELNQEQQQSKAKQLDSFWEQTRAAGPIGVSCLKQVLSEEKEDGFFLFDAASLLLELDASPASLLAAAEAIQRCDLNEIDPVGYLRQVFWLARRGIDTGAMAGKYMRHPKVTAYLVEHGGFKLDRILGAILLYGSMDPAASVDHLKPLFSAPLEETRIAAFAALSTNLTAEAFRQLQERDEDILKLPEQLSKNIRAPRMYSAPVVSQTTKFNREQVLGRMAAVRNVAGPADEARDNPPYITDVEGFEPSAVATLTPDDLPLVLETRRRSIRGVSDESLYEYFAWTRIILGIINRFDLYKELRIHQPPAQE